MSKTKIINVKKNNIGTIQQILYKDNVKKTYLYNEKNKSNFYTIIKELYDEKLEKHYLYSKLEIGEKYLTYFRYSENEIIFEKRINKEKKTSNIKELFLSTEKGKIFINDYNNEKSINFITNKLKNGTKE